MVSIRATNNFSLAWLEKLCEVQKCVKILFIIAMISNEFQLRWYHPELKKLAWKQSYGGYTGVRGLTITLEKGMTNVKLESDSLVLAKMINEDTTKNHPQTNIINDAKNLINRTGTTLTHIFRENFFFFREVNQ